ncbi:MAG TPA: DUF2147 domain-containing protein [Bacteroidales bacterium]|nr:DUF2147 domain-containing protein [Bacteroidales bacterium]
MKKYILFSLCFIFLSLSGFSQIDKILGKWKTVDDATGATKSVVYIFKATNGKYYGKIEKIFKEPDKLCTKCSGENKNQPIMGMRIINDMHLKDDALTGGTILDPENGKVYKCNISYDSKTGNLLVRGSLDKAGVLGRTQKWIKIKE